MQLGIISLFPDMFQALQYGIPGRAQQRGLLDITLLNPRDFTEDAHRTVDDRPYGGGPGMVMMAEPLAKTINVAKEKLKPTAKVIYLSPQGQPLTHEMLIRLKNENALILLCGRYEGIDERLINTEVDEEISIGDYVLSGGEFAAMVLIDALTRLLPGALGHEESASQDSFFTGLLDCPHYTRPEEYAGVTVPAVVLSGNHAQIAQWRKQQALGRTWQRRPDLLAKKVLTAQEQQLLAEFINRDRGNNDE